MTTFINNSQSAIQTVTPTLSIGEIQLSADNRSTKEKKLTDAERIRRAVLPAGHWDITASIGDKPNQSLTDALRSALVRLASDKLREYLTEQPGATTINHSDYTVAAVLGWSAETATSRGALTVTKEEILEWLESSSTFTALCEKHAANPNLAAIKELVRTRFSALAARNHGLKEESDALKLLALIHEDDMADSVVVEIVGRIQHIIKQLAAKKAEATVDMDSL